MEEAKQEDSVNSSEQQNSEMPAEAAPVEDGTGDSKAMRMMKNMGYEPGKGLGKRKQGIPDPIAVKQKIGRMAFGAEFQPLVDFDAESEIKTIEESPTWLHCTEEKRAQVAQKLCDEWIVSGKPKMTLDDEDRFCARELIRDMLDAKSVFDTVDHKDLDNARARANPYETIKSGFFQNRAAVKTANLDKIYQWRLSREFEEHTRKAKNPLEEGKPRQNADRERPIFYFADVCAGPGGFSEYMLWRKAFYNAKGFGFTLTGRDDFKLERFKAAPAEYFEPYYGVKNNGDVMDPENLESLEQFVRERIHGPEKGVHLVMCDGGFSVEGQENIQEILSKRLYLCQFITGLSLCRVSTGKRRGGNFLCKLFDLFTPFSMGLVYLMYASFENISIHKPITSRPANSERYIFCENLNQLGATRVHDHLVEVNNRMNTMDNKKEDVLQLVPIEVIQADGTFMEYMRKSNEQIARRQIFYLHKYRKFAQEPGVYDQDQQKLRDEAIRYWELPEHIERPQEMRRHRGPNQQFVKQEREPAATTLARLTGNYPLFPSKKTRLRPFKVKEAMNCLDQNELRALLLTDPAEPMLLLSQGFKNIFLLRRNADNFEMAGDMQCFMPKDTLLLVQIAQLYEAKSAGKVEPVRKCVWVLDAAVLNGDDVSQLELKDRLLAARKFAEAINHRHNRRPVFEKRDRHDKRGEFSGHEYTDFCELIVAEPMRIGALTERKFEIKSLKGAKVAFFAVHARDDPREQPPQRHFLTCRGIRVLNKLNPNFMLQSAPDANGQHVEAVVPRVSAMFSQLMHQNPSNSFYESFVGHLPRERWIATFANPPYSGQHPHEGHITFHWSWEPDFTDKYTVENILSDPEHKGGLTMQQLRQIVCQQQQQAKPKQEIVDPSIVKEE